MSVAGGLEKSFERIKSVGGTALQIFTRNQRQWKAAPIARDEARQFARAWKEWGAYPVFSHASYLINAATPDPAAAAKSRDALVGELERCRALSIPWAVLHPGSHLGRGAGAGCASVAALLDEAFEQADAPGVGILLETTAGQGTGLGAVFEELGLIMQKCSSRVRLGVCFDTCHSFAAGYDFRTPQGFAKTLAGFEAACGPDALRLVHVNDSKTPLGSRRDRHAHIGQGEIGLSGFAPVVRHCAARGIPMVLETPKDDDLEDDRRNMALIRGLVS